MTIPWMDLSLPSNQCLHPTNLDPNPKSQEPEAVVEKGRPEYSDIHPFEKVDPSVSSEICIFPEINFDFLLDLESHCFVECKTSVKEELLSSFETLYSRIFIWSRFMLLEPVDSPSLLSDVFCDDSCLDNIVFGHSPNRRLSLTGQGLARFTLRLSLVFFLLLIVDTDCSFHNSKNLQNNQTIKLFTPSANLHGPVYLIHSVLLKEVQKCEVWSNPKQKFKTVGKHRCYCTKNSFFVSHHDPSESDLEPFDFFGSIP